MNRIISICIVVALSLLGHATLAYEIDTHEKISEATANSSVLKTDSDILRRMGLRFQINNDQQKLPNSKGRLRNILSLIKDGSNFEDSLLFIRPIHHFYDPISGDALLPILAKPSPSWALEDKGQISFPLFQRFSFADGRDYFYRALTANTPDDHDLYFGKTFEVLGHVIHHIQDMAQPQHVRLDAHLKLSDADQPDWFFENGSRYEAYTKGLGGNLPFNTYAPINVATDANFLSTARSFWHTAQGGGMGLAEFTNTNFVSAGTNFRGAFQDGGLIAWSNERYPLPAPSPTTPTFELANNLLGQDTPLECAPPNNPCVMAFFSSEVKDNYRQTSQVNDRASTASIFDQDLELHGKTVPYPNLDKCTDPSNPKTCEQIETNQIFSLNRFNFDAAHEFLIPRAVAYSAGLIDYFFRGKLGAEDVTFTDTGVSLRVKNAIDPVKTPAWANEILYAKNSSGSAGSLVVAFDYQDSAGKTHYGVSEPIPVRAVDTLAPDQVSVDPYNFTLTVPSEAKDVNYRLIFRGKLGQEDDAIAVGVVEPISGFLVTPNYLPTDGITGPRAIFKQGGQWRLSDKKDLVAGNIDWKGWYRNGRPTKVLSWSGPKARSFPDSSNSSINTFDTKIYQNGEIWAVAPHHVLGAALTKDSAGNEWIIAICKNGYVDVVYRRPNTKSNLPALYHPDNAPEGWEQIGSFSWNSNIYYQADIPWFFNGDGTQAQTIRAGNKDFGPPNGVVWWPYRLHIQILHDVTEAMLANEGNLSGITSSLERSQTCSNSDYKFSEERASNGELYIAVDYRNNTPVFATFSQSGNSRNTFDSIYISGSGYTRSREYDLAYTITISISGFPDIDFGSGHTTLRALDSSSSSTLFFDFIEISSQFHYLDLRHNLYSVYTASKTKQATGPSRPIGTGMAFPVAITTQSKQTTKFTTESAIFNENSPSVTDAYEQAYRIYSNLDSGFLAKCNTSSSSTADPDQFAFAPKITPVPNYVGSWAVDSSNNIFSSQATLANNPAVMTGRIYNYLSNGDPPQVISGASAEPIYSKIGVIK